MTIKRWSIEHKKIKQSDSFAMIEDPKGVYVQYADYLENMRKLSETVIILRAELDTALSAVARASDWPNGCGDIEQDAFETWAASQHYDMTLHPRHWLFMNEKTWSARHGWAAGLTYAAERIRAALKQLTVTGPNVGDNKSENENDKR